MSTHDSNRAYLNHRIVHSHITYLHRAKPSTIDTLSQFKATKQERNTQDRSLHAGAVPLQRRQNTRNSSSPSVCRRLYHYASEHESGVNSGACPDGCRWCQLSGQAVDTRDPGRDTSVNQSINKSTAKKYGRKIPDIYPRWRFRTGALRGSSFPVDLWAGESETQLS